MTRISNAVAVGDRVRCVSPCRELAAGRTYTVAYVDNDDYYPRAWGCARIELVGVGIGAGFRADRFERVEEDV
jgi:hypothetical protein